MLYTYKVAITPFTAKCAGNAQKLHEFLCSLVCTDRKSANLLYRFDPKNGYLFLQSDVKPEETKNFQLLHTLDIDKILSRKKNGDCIHFRLTTDTHMKKTVNGVTKKVYVPTERTVEWLTEKLGRYGVDTSSVTEIQKQNVVFSHDESKGGNATVTLHDFDIYGTITDIDTLKAAWHKGMGEHKAYGNGLFLLCR